MPLNSLSLIFLKRRETDFWDDYYNKMNIQNAVQSAFNYYQAGRFHEAEQICKKILHKQPSNVYALNFLGILSYQVGNNWKHTLT